MNKDSRIFVAASAGMIGSAILRCLKDNGFNALLASDRDKIDLTQQSMVSGYFETERPEYVFLPSIKHGGIMANKNYPAELIYSNAICQANVIHSAWQCGVRKLLFLGSSCIYPKDCPQPMREEYLLSGNLEPTSEAYSIAKIAGIKMCQSYNQQYGTNFITAVPADVYGPGDDFNPETSHVLPGLMARIHRAKQEGNPEVVVWGTGSPKREAFYVDDLASACLFLMENYDDSSLINVGYGEDITIADMARVIKDTVGYIGRLVFDTSKPDGMPRKFLDTTRMFQLGWSPATSLEQGVEQTYRWYLDSSLINI